MCVTYEIAGRGRERKLSKECNKALSLVSPGVGVAPRGWEKRRDGGKKAQRGWKCFVK